MPVPSGRCFREDASVDGLCLVGAAAARGQQLAEAAQSAVLGGLHAADIAARVLGRLLQGAAGEEAQGDALALHRRQVPDRGDDLPTVELRDDAVLRAAQPGAVLDGLVGEHLAAVRADFAWSRMRLRAMVTSHAATGRP